MYYKQFVIRAFLSVVFYFLSPVTLADISFTSANFTAQEDSGVITVSANLQANCFGECYDTILIDYSVTAGTATAGVDYTAVSGTLSWTANGIQSFQIPIVVDADIEVDESMTVTLSNCIEQSFGSPFTCSANEFTLSAINSSATILNDDFPVPGNLSLTSSTVNVTEGGAATVSVTRAGGSDGAQSIDYLSSDNTALAASDYSSVSGTLSWADGESGVKSITIATIQDTEIEVDESFFVTLSNLVGGASLSSGSSATVTVINDDFPIPGSLSLNSSAINVAEGSAATISVTRAGGSDGAISIDYASSDNTALAASDYVSVSGSLSWADGEAGAKSITIATLTDVLIENDESFTLTLSNLVGDATLSSGFAATITISNTTQAISELENLTPNQKVVAEELDKMCVGATGNLLLRCQDIFNSGLSNEQLRQVIESMTPDHVSSQGNIANDFGFQQLKVVHGRIVSLRQTGGAASRISVTGFSLNSFGQKIPVGQIAQTMIYNALGGGSGDEPLRDLPLGVFIKGQVDIGDKKSSNSETGFDVDSKSITVGFDYQFTDQLLIGVASGYGHSDTEFDSNAGDMESHSGNFSIYGSYYLPKDFYIDAILSYSINAYDSSRAIVFPGFQGSASSTPFGDQYGGSIGFGKDFYIRNFFISPYLRAEYLITGIDEYSEKGGGGLALRVSKQSMNSFISTLGGQMSQAISMPWGVISPGIRFEWRHQFRDDQRTIHSQLINAPAGTGSFSIKTEDPDRDYFNLGASLAVTLPEGRSAFIRYETRLGQTDMTNHTIEAAVRMPF